MSLKTQDSVWLEDCECDVTTEEDYRKCKHQVASRDRKYVNDPEWAGLTDLLHDVSQFTKSFLWKTFESRNTVETDFDSLFYTFTESSLTYRLALAGYVSVDVWTLLAGVQPPGLWCF